MTTVVFSTYVGEITSVPLDSLSPDTHYGVSNLWVGQFYVGGSKSLDDRTILRADLSSLIGWTLTSAKLSSHVQIVYGASFSAYLMRVTQTWDNIQATYNKASTSPSVAWLTTGADQPNSATTTGRITFNSPSATGIQDIVTDAALLTMVQWAIANNAGILLFNILSVNNNPGSNRYFQGGTNIGPTDCAAYLTIVGTAPAGTKLGQLPSGTMVASSFSPTQRRFGSVPSNETVNPAAGARRLGAVPSDELVPNSWV